MTEPKNPIRKTHSSEAHVKQSVKQIIESVKDRFGVPIWYFMPPANGFGRSGIMDYVGTVLGKSFAIETKYGGNTTTAHQSNEIAAAIKAGARVWVVDEKNLPSFYEQLCAFVASAVLEKAE